MPQAKHTPANIVSHYLGSTLDCNKLNEHVNNIVQTLRPIKKTFDTVAFRGMSGALVAPLVAAKMKKHLIMVRKPGDGSHSQYTVEGNINSQAYIIIDDFISTGNTCRAIIDAIANWQTSCAFNFYNVQATCVGIAVYLTPRDFVFNLWYNQPGTTEVTKYKCYGCKPVE